MSDLYQNTVFYGVFRYFHLLAAVIAIGGTFAMRYVVIPALDDEDPAMLNRFHTTARRKLMTIILAAIGFLIVSGCVNLIRAFAVAPVPPVTYHMILGIKLILAVALFVVATLLVLPSYPPNAVQRKRRFWLTFNAHLGFLIIALSVAMKFMSGK